MRLLRIEWFKIRPFRLFWILMAIYLVVLVIMMLGFEAVIMHEMKQKLGFSTSFSLYKFPKVWHYLSYLASWFQMIPAIIMVTLVYNEITYKTFRQQIIDGLSRREVFMAKLWLGVILCLITTAVVFIIGMIMGLIKTPYFDVGMMFSQIEFIPAFFVEMLGFTMFSLLLSLWIQRAGIVIGIIFLYSFLAEPILSYYTGQYVHEYATLLLPLKSIGHVIPFPFFNFNSIGDALSISLPDLGAAVAYTGLYAGLAYRVIARRAW